ncbi:hypothetical protein OAL55_02485 [Verrucomicrobiales bacterium]|jgi:hypothetical protein|nr:hypothetical protein [Verrucomicrobiales bacterium]MDC0314200.1 hypothetical protein [bacterium]MDC0322211.1 hypothetical protein [Verrucomicrobiales bacterium]
MNIAFCDPMKKASVVVSIIVAASLLAALILKAQRTEKIPDDSVLSFFATEYITRSKSIAFNDVVVLGGGRDLKVDFGYEIYLRNSFLAEGLLNDFNEQRVTIPSSHLAKLGVDFFCERQIQREAPQAAPKSRIFNNLA